ncbi:MAG: type II toxin-antitoxin system VapB family antitoxin [Chloroflexi bacterium]|nr:type II toxin-antitoxin system VapB family antitoxin [Chloroflexota bacterium]
MRTTLDIDSALLDKVVDATGEKTKSKAVNSALKEYIRRKQVQEFIDSWGKIVVDDYSKEVEEANRKRHEFLDSIGRDSDR